MGNKSKQRVGDRAGLSWKKIRETEPQRFIHAPMFNLAPRRTIEHPEHSRFVEFKPRAQTKIQKIASAVVVNTAEQPWQKRERKARERLLKKPHMGFNDRREAREARLNPNPEKK